MSTKEQQARQARTRIIKTIVWRCQDCPYSRQIQHWLHQHNASAVCCEHGESQRLRSPESRDVYSVEIPEWCPLPKMGDV